MITIENFYEWAPFSIEENGEEVFGRLMVEPDPVNGNPIIHDIEIFSLTNQLDLDKVIAKLETEMF